MSFALAIEVSTYFPIFGPQMRQSFLRYLLFTVVGLVSGCANITTPTGGKKDVIPPKRLSVTPADSLKNTRLQRIELKFDEYITVNDAAKEVTISPLLAVNPVITGIGHKVVVKIPDTLLEENTTYRISFGTAIRDLHEGNAYTGYTYVFSTGGWFDSMQLSGKVINAATGLPDSAGVNVVLYYASDGDSAVVRRKPRYITRADASGDFSFKGLPQKAFLVYGLKDANDNMMFDGENEMIAFLDRTVTPGDTSKKPLELYLFTQPGDSSLHAETDTTLKPHSRNGINNASNVFSYNVNVDTGNRSKRTFDINKTLTITFTRHAAVNKDKITLVADSNGTEVPGVYTVMPIDSQHRVIIKATLEENTVYTLKLAKGFAKDSSGAEVLPGRFTFRTKEGDDYGKITIHLPAKYKEGYVLQVLADNDSVYQQKVTGSVVELSRLRPAKYQFRLINDRNGNGKWDPGNLFEKLQPEEVIPYKDILNLKAGWENVIDFETQPALKTGDKRR